MPNTVSFMNLENLSTKEIRLVLDALFKALIGFCDDISQIEQQLIGDQRSPEMLQEIRSFISRTEHYVKTS